MIWRSIGPNSQGCYVNSFYAIVLPEHCIVTAEGVNDINILGKVVLTFGILILAFFLGIFFLIMSLAFITSTNAVWALGVIYFIIILTLCIFVWSKPIYRKTKKVFLAIGLIAIFACIMSLAYDSYVDSIPTVNEAEYAVKLGEYQPFEGARVKSLKENSTLSLVENLPKIDCATALYPIAAAFVQAAYPPGKYERYSTDGPAYLGCSGTSGAYEALIKGEADIIFAAGPSDDQWAQANKAGVELNLTPIGKDAFVFFVNNNNSVDDLTVEQIQGIYGGTIKNWSEVGGKHSSIKAFQRSINSGSQTALVRLMNGKELTDPPKEDVISAMGGIIEEVSDYKNFKSALGFSFRYYATEMVNNNQIKLLKINGVYPSKDTIRSGAYPLGSEFYAVTTNSNNPNAASFLEWVLSPQGQYLIEETGYVGINPNTFDQ